MNQTALVSVVWAESRWEVGTSLQGGSWESPALVINIANETAWSVLPLIQKLLTYTEPCSSAQPNCVLTSKSLYWKLSYVGVLESSKAAITNYHRLGDLNNRFISHSSGSWDVKDQYHKQFGSCQIFLPGLQVATFNTIMKVSPSWLHLHLITSQRPHLQNYHIGC